ncbi:hypothetical protein AB0L06_17110 [Spirillospora sp. NPDC052269]
MIGKLGRGTRVEGLLRYLFGPDAEGRPRDAHIVAGFRSPAELEPVRRPDGRRDLRPLGTLLNQPLKLLGERNYRKPVWHLSLRAAPEDPVLTDAQWARIARRMMDRVGLAPVGDPDAVRWVAVRHAVDHIHVVAMLACVDGHRPDVWKSARLVRDGCRAVEDELGLRWSAPFERTAAPGPTRGEMERARREGRTEHPRATLRRHVQEAAAIARTERDFFERLGESGVLVRHRNSRENPEQVVGYAVALPDYRSAAGSPVWFGGAKLAADLTLPKLRARWPAAVPPVSGRGLDALTVRAYLRASLRRAAAGEFWRDAEPSDDEYRAIYRDAARAAAFATEEIRRDIVIDPDAVRDACWATADLFRSVALATGDPVLGRAADAYDRAARPPHGRIPPRTAAGERLRGMARVLGVASTGEGPGREILAALASALQALVDAIHDFYQLTRQRAQAAAARTVSRHLAEVARDRSAWPSTPVRAEQRTAAQIAAADIPHPGTVPVFGVPQAPPPWRPRSEPSRRSRGRRG